MRIACLQFAPQVCHGRTRSKVPQSDTLQLGDVDNNLNRADAVLNRANPQDIDLLVLPELAFTGQSVSGAMRRLWVADWC